MKWKGFIYEDLSAGVSRGKSANTKQSQNCAALLSLKLIRLLQDLSPTRVFAKPLNQPNIINFRSLRADDGPSGALPLFFITEPEQPLTNKISCSRVQIYQAKLALSLVQRILTQWHNFLYFRKISCSQSCTFQEFFIFTGAYISATVLKSRKIDSLFYMTNFKKFTTPEILLQYFIFVKSVSTTAEQFACYFQCSVISVHFNSRWNYHLILRVLYTCGVSSQLSAVAQSTQSVCRVCRCDIFATRRPPITDNWHYSGGAGLLERRQKPANKKACCAFAPRFKSFQQDHRCQNTHQQYARCSWNGRALEKKRLPHCPWNRDWASFVCCYFDLSHATWEFHETRFYKRTSNNCFFALQLWNK